MEPIYIILICITLVLLTYQQGKIFYFRHIKTYKKEIKDYITSNNLILITKRNPNKKDWIESPFEKPPFFEISLSIQLNNMPITWTDKKYKVIIYEKNNETNQVWLEIKTTWFKKPQLDFVLAK